MLIKIKEKVPGSKITIDRQAIKRIHSQVTTHEGEILVGVKGEQYRKKWVENGKYKLPIKRGEGNWKSPF